MYAKSAEKTVGLTRFLWRSLPPSRVSFVLIIALSFAVGALTGAVEGLRLELISYEAVRAVFLIAIPSMLGAVACISLRRGIKHKQILFLSLLSSLLYGVLYFAHFSGLAARLGLAASYSFDLMLLANAFIFALWYVVARIVFSLRYSSFLFGLITPTLNVMFLLADRSLSVGMPESIAVLTKLYFAALIFLTAIYALFWFINAPLKRNFGVSATEALSMFLAQWYERSPRLEKVLEEVGEEINTMVGLLAFRAGGRLKAVFIIPHIHYGPFGNIGGSEFPHLISKEVQKRTGALPIVLHGCATHDFNPVAAVEIEKFNEKIFAALQSMKFEKARGAVCFGRSGTARSEGLLINGIYLAPLTRAPRTTEDIEFSVGLAIRNYALAKGAREALVFDAHNAETGEITKFESGSPVSFEYMYAVGDALERKPELGRLRLGVAHDPLADFPRESGVGGAGLSVAVFEIDGEEYAMVTFDANGITPAFRREVIDAVAALGVKNAEVFTTDTHSVNMIAGVLNPLGARTGREEVLRRTVKAVEKARKNLEEVEMGYALETVEGVRVFGIAQSSEFVGTVNSIVAVMRIIAPLILIGATAFALWVMTNL